MGGDYFTDLHYCRLDWMFLKKTFKLTGRLNDEGGHYKARCFEVKKIFYKIRKIMREKELIIPLSHDYFP